MKTSYSIEGQGNKVQVNGSLKEDGEVIVKYNGEEFVFHSGKGNFSSGAASASVHCDDGSYVEEGATSQEIKLPNGVVIKKGAASEKMHLPSGETIKNSPHNDPNSNVIVDQPGLTVSVKSSSNTKIRMETNSSSNSKIQYESSESVAEEEIESDEKDDSHIVSTNKLISALVPGFWTILFVLGGLMAQSSFFIMLGVFIYSLVAIPITLKFTLQRIPMLLDQDEEDNLVTESEIEKIQKKYENDEIDEKQLEEELEEAMTEDKREKELQVS